jgi:CheY-like chemotaxis protein
MDAIATILDALSKLAWPILVAVILWKLYPSIRGIIDSRGFTVKVGEMEVTVQEASDQLRTQVEDLQEKVSGLRLQVEGAQAATGLTLAAEPREPEPKPIKRVLWVDDNPENNAFEIAKLRDDDLQVVQATSTDEAMGILLSGRLEVDAIVSDMGRRERGKNQPEAGLTLIQEARGADIQVPIFVYASPRAVARYRDEIREAGGSGATASPIELFELIRTHGDTGSP